jgi:hypothetical protein
MCFSGIVVCSLVANFAHNRNEVTEVNSVVGEPNFYSKIVNPKFHFPEL